MASSVAVTTRLATAFLQHITTFEGMAEAISRVDVLLAFAAFSQTAGLIFLQPFSCSLSLPLPPPNASAASFRQRSKHDNKAAVQMGQPAVRHSCRTALARAAEPSWSSRSLPCDGSDSQGCDCCLSYPFCS